MIKPDAYNNIGKIVDIIERQFRISKMKMVRFTREIAEEFYGEHKGKPFFEELINFICSDLVVGLELVCSDAITKWRNLIGPTNCQVARIEQPNSIRALFGREGVKNAVHGSDSPQSAAREIDIFFSEKSPFRTTAIFNNCTCCIIKPHALEQKCAGQIIDFILTEGFEISALETFNLDRPTAEEFLEVYKDVLPEFKPMAEQLTSGTCVVMEIRQENAVKAFREICGPHDPELSRQGKKFTIRGKFGLDKIQNAVHCTDLPEDGLLEVEYFFNILQQK